MRLTKLKLWSALEIIFAHQVFCHRHSSISKAAVNSDICNMRKQPSFITSSMNAVKTGEWDFYVSHKNKQAKENSVIMDCLPWLQWTVLLFSLSVYLSVCPHSTHLWKVCSGRYSTHCSSIPQKQTGLLSLNSSVIHSKVISFFLSQWHNHEFFS